MLNANMIITTLCILRHEAVWKFSLHRRTFESCRRAESSNKTMEPHLTDFELQITGTEI